MSENSDSYLSSGASAAETGRGANLDGLRTFRNVMRGLFVTSIVAVLILVCLAKFVVWMDSLEPKTEHILSNEGWSPFLEGLTQVSNARQSIDDGSIVFTMHPPIEDWNVYVERVTEDASRAGWVNVASEDTRFRERRYAVRGYARSMLKKSTDAGDPIRSVFIRDHEPDYEADSRTKEVVEIARLDETGAVLFVSYFAYDQQFTRHGTSTLGLAAPCGVRGWSEG